ncbi:MAG: hypothetical protein N5P05_002348 [Chroococcopsis gigantea SAG 12.99]|jgi:drug/metabolite transporter (DMT)-like permease|nr:DUF4079 domain-containing protein [Chlorogloea purpurea SAG 13.99]MDV3000742.1 hypothetical protein [Chroococcopsis gigantea SAG 12.99]
MDFLDFVSLIHPFLAIVVVFPLLGLVLNFAWQTRQRRLQTGAEKKSKIPPQVGPEHLRLGKLLAGSVIGVMLIALAYSVVYGSGGFLDKQKDGKLESFQVIFIGLMFAFTIASLVFLYRARTPLWRGILATLTGMGLVVLGAQDGVFRRTDEWYWSHYYIGLVAALLMVFSLAIIDDIYKDRSHKWRVAHTVLNSIAVILFLGQGFTGSRDLLEIPLGWQKPYIYKCDWKNKTCPQLKSGFNPGAAPFLLTTPRIVDI